MKIMAMSGLVLVCCSGAVFAAQETPTRLEPSVGNLKHVAHFYYNIGTGEMITTLLDLPGEKVPAYRSSTEDEIWTSTHSSMCDSYGDTTSQFFILNDVSDTTTLDDVLFDWGDLPMDTVVDCVQVHWISNHQDSDANNDSIPDGVEGFAGVWIYWDGMNGRAPIFDCSGAPLISFTLSNLPGELSDPNDEGMAFYTADIDLAGSFGTSLTFEIGDTDGDLQGAAVHNSQIDETVGAHIPGLPDSDLDGNGLADWGWSVSFIQPGTIDVDNADGDGDRYTGIDGDPDESASTGLALAAPSPGHPEFCPDTGEWSWISDGPSVGVTEDLFNTASIVGSSIVMQGPWFFGGLDCTPDEAGYVPAAMFQTILYGPGNLMSDCATDLNEDGHVDFFDISFFVAFSIDYNEDTVFDFFDVSLFLTEYAAGCP